MSTKFSANNDPSNSNEPSAFHNMEMDPSKEHDQNPDKAKKPKDTRLQDIEQQLEMAESRCNNLKEQLGYMKEIYGVSQNKSPLKIRKISTRNTPQDPSGVLEGASNDNLKSPKPFIKRQKSNHIGTDNTGAAVRTINNILNGITNSVNRLSEIHSQITTPRMTVNTGVSPERQHCATESVDVSVVPEINYDSKICHSRCLKRRRKKNPKTSSQQALRKQSSEKRMRPSIGKSTPGLEMKSYTVIKSKFNMKTNKLVEIYHNDAIKHSDSDEINAKKPKNQGDVEVKEEVPPINVHISNDPQESSKSVVVYPRTSVSCFSRNYELPTVASRMKQVTKSYLATINLKTIPFCAAISTTQSHNIGINIQQVMSIIKNKQPIKGISPTLAHNIGLAAEKLNNRPFSAMVSAINSKISHMGSKCPLSRTYLNFHQLQEQAKNIPEEAINEADEDDTSPPTHNTFIITGPSGDVKIKTKNAPSWRIDKSAPLELCTCVAQPNVSFQQVSNKYSRNFKTENSSLNSQMMDKRIRKFTAKNASNSQTTPSNQICHKESTLIGRENNLKEVLTNLHDDFDSLNRKYEELSQKNQNQSSEESLKELERLEQELNKKEEEITMVMTLYKEVLALKQQVQQLKEKRSQGSLASKDTKLKFKEYNNPEAAFHLTKLLKQIQIYQMRYKCNLSQE